MNSYNFFSKNLLIYIAFFLLTSCNSNSVYSYPPNEYSGRYSILESESIRKINEISSWNITDVPISLIKYNNLSNSLIAVSEENKEIVKLHVATGETEIRNILNITNFRVFGVDRKGEKLLGAMTRTGLNSRGESTEYLQWFATWDTNSGLQIDCSWGSCNGADDREQTDIGVSADLDIEAIITFSETVYSTQTSESSGFALVNNADADYWYHIGNIAIDSRNDRLAIVYQEGRIELHAIQPSILSTVLEKGDEDQLQPIHAALFDRKGKWLAIIRGNQLSIWNVGGWFKKIVYSEDVGTIHGMSFSPSSKFLLLGTNDKIKIINLDKNRLETELSTPRISSLDISEDNRLLFWGDENGAVHLWGVP